VTKAQTETFKSIKDDINLQSIVEIVDRYPEGITQRQVFEVLYREGSLTATEIGALYQLVSRNLSTAAKQGLLDDSHSIRVGRGYRTLYRVPAQPLPPRKTKTQILKEENLELRLTIQRMQREQAEKISMIKATAANLEETSRSLGDINFNAAYDG
jgi:hypothetical protein